MQINSPPPGGHMGVHGMVVFGKNYLSHIPMFHEPHDYQIIMDVKLEHPDLGPDANFGRELHTFVPNKFSLGDLFNGKLDKIEGTLYKGNFEAEGAQPLQEGVTAKIEHILHSHHLSQDQQGPQDLEYLLYGDRQDAYLVHPIHGNAGFDQVLSVDCRQVNATDQELKDGILIRLPGRPNEVHSRLVEGTPEVGAVEADGDAVRLEVKKELSILVGPHFTGGPDEHQHHHH